jgi:TRAP-type mannitol/chloroaromatic compound transport system permease large subunit
VFDIRVAQVVEADVLQPVLGQQPVEMLCHKVRADQLTFLIGADEVQIIGAVLRHTLICAKILPIFAQMSDFQLIKHQLQVSHKGTS